MHPRKVTLGGSPQQTVWVGPFDKGAPPLPQGAAAVRARVAAEAYSAVGKKLADAATSQWNLFVSHCSRLKVDPLPWNTDTCYLHLTQKAVDARAATSVRNHMSMLRAYVRRNALAEDFTEQQWKTMEMHFRDLEKKYGTYHHRPPALEWESLKECWLKLPTSANHLRATLMVAAVAQACALRPNEFCAPTDPRKVMVRAQDITIFPQSAAFPRGAVEIKLYRRKDAVASGFELDLAATATGEPQCEELDFVKYLQEQFTKYDLTKAPEEPLFAQTNAAGGRVFHGSTPFRGARPMNSAAFNASLKAAFAVAHVDRGGATARGLRIARRTDLASAGTPDGVADALMGHGRKRQRLASMGSGYIRVSKKLLPATRLKVPSAEECPPEEDIEEV